MHLKESAYNFIYDDLGKDQIVFYNSRTGALAVVHEDQYKQYKGFQEKGKEIEDAEFLKNLLKCGYLLPAEVDEKFLIKTNMMQGRYNKNLLSLTIAPTMACNFRCIYCFEKGHYGNSLMDGETQIALMNFIKSHLDGVKNINVTWFGGEPLLGMSVIESLSEQIIALCEEKELQYQAGIITNGYLLTPENAEKLKKYNVRYAQVTVDGPKEIHNERRPTVNGQGTYDVIMNNLKSMPVSRFLIPLVSTVWIFSVMGGMGMHVLAEQPTEVQAVRRQFSTLEEVTAVQVQEEGSTVRFLPGEGEEVCVRYADTTAEALYEIQVENGTLVVQKLKAPPPKVVTINGTIMQFEVDSAYDLEIVLPQRQYKSIVVENPSGGNVEMDSITAKEICTELKNGSSVFSKTQSDRIKSEIENGSVVFEHPTSSQYDCTVKNGEIKGDVVGRYEDYTVKARVKNGSCMLKSRLDAANQHAMNLYVENGRIEVHFKN